ncbi:MAG: hypothetical protein ACPGWR_16745 [Ardenticatenaceae bacterium]
MIHFSTRYLFFLFVSFRLTALLLYRPGGLLGVGEAYVGLPALGLGDALWRQLVGGLLLFPFEVGSLWLLLQLLRRYEGEEEARWRAILWAVSPLPLWGWLTGGVPLIGFLLLAAYWVTGLGRRSWLWAALPLAFATLVEGPMAELTSLLLPFILLLMPSPALSSALFTLAALLAGPVTGLLGVTGPAATAFLVAYIVALTPVLAEWLWMLRPVMGWERWRQPVLVGAAVCSMLLFGVALFVLAPRELRAAHLATSRLAPALNEMQVAPSGWFLSDSHDLWEEAVSLGVGSLTPYVVSERNREQLRAQLVGSPTFLWLLQSPNEKERIDALLEPLLADFFAADKQTFEDGTRLHRFVSGLEAPLLPIEGTFEDGIALVGARLPAAAPAGGLLAIELHWQDEPGSQKLFLHLIAPDGSLATQRDTLPQPTKIGEGEFGEVDRHALILPATLTEGTYTLLAGRYHPESGQRVGLLQGGETIVVAEIEVTK